MTHAQWQSQQNRKAQNPKRRSRRPRGPRGDVRATGGSTGTGSRVVGAPSSVGVVTSNSYFKMDGKAQQNAEISGMGDSCRVVGCDLFGTAIATGAGSATAPLAGATGIVLTPNNISPRLRNMEELYQYYAIRKLRMEYMPMCPTTTSGAVALGLAQNSLNVASVTYTTQQQVLETTPSVLAPVWQAASTEYTHTGTKLWYTSSSSVGDSSEADQLVLLAVIANGLISTGYGQIRLEYTIDFYKPTPVESSPSRISPVTKLSLKRSSEEKVDRAGIFVPPPNVTVSDRLTATVIGPKREDSGDGWVHAEETPRTRSVPPSGHSKSVSGPGRAG